MSLEMCGKIQIFPSDSSSSLIDGFMARTLNPYFKVFPSLFVVVQSLGCV